MYKRQGLDTLLAKLDEVLSDRVHTLRVLLPYDKLGLAAPMREPVSYTHLDVYKRQVRMQQIRRLLPLSRRRRQKTAQTAP